jgi:hypothetical protein
MAEALTYGMRGKTFDGAPRLHANGFIGCHAGPPGFGAVFSSFMATQRAIASQI